MSAFFAWVAGSGIVQGLIMGLAFGYLTAVVVLNAVARSQTTTVNGWSSIRGAGQPGNGIVMRAALQKALPVVNVFEEAAYWTATRDAAGELLRGAHTYCLHFPPGQLPPHSAFWSLTATDTAGYIVAGASGRASVDSRAGLVPNADGSVDILLQAYETVELGTNWLPTPSGRFKLMLRAYLPGPAILDGSYQLPSVVERRP